MIFSSLLESFSSEFDISLDSEASSAVTLVSGMKNIPKAAANAQKRPKMKNPHSDVIAD